MSHSPSPPISLDGSSIQMSKRLGFSENKKRNRNTSDGFLNTADNMPGSESGLISTPPSIGVSSALSGPALLTAEIPPPTVLHSNSTIPIHEHSTDGARYNSPSSKFYNPLDPLRSDVATWRRQLSDNDSNRPNIVLTITPKSPPPLHSLSSSRWADLAEEQSNDLGPVMATDDILPSNIPSHSFDPNIDTPVDKHTAGSAATPSEETHNPISEPTPPAQQVNDEQDQRTAEEIAHEFNNWHLSEDCNEALATITTRSAQNWASKPHIVITLDLEEIARDIRDLLDHAMLFYFTARVPSLNDFRNWVEKEFRIKRGWHLRQVKFVGHNYFMVSFLHTESRKKALLCAPWYYQRRFVYTKVWDPNFDVTAEQREIPVWIEIPFRSLVLEKYRKGMVEELGDILVYLKGETLSEYPHDRACILWDTSRPTPESISFVIGGHVLWQEVTFRNLPISCYRCNSRSHSTDQCPHEIAEEVIPSSSPKVDESEICKDNTREGKLPAKNPNTTGDFSMHNTEEEDLVTALHESLVSPCTNTVIVGTTSGSHSGRSGTDLDLTASTSASVPAIPSKCILKSFGKTAAVADSPSLHANHSDLQLTGSVITVLRNQSAAEVFNNLCTTYEDVLTSPTGEASDAVPDNFPPLSDHENDEAGITNPNSLIRATGTEGHSLITTSVEVSPAILVENIKTSNRKRNRSGKNRSRAHRQLDFPFDSFQELLQQQISTSIAIAPRLSDDDLSSCANPLDDLESLSQFDTDNWGSDAFDLPDGAQSS